MPSANICIDPRPHVSNSKEALGRSASIPPVEKSKYDDEPLVALKKSKLQLKKIQEMLIFLPKRICRRTRSRFAQKT